MGFYSAKIELQNYSDVTVGAPYYCVGAEMKHYR